MHGLWIDTTTTQGSDGSTRTAAAAAAAPARAAADPGGAQGHAAPQPWLGPAPHAGALAGGPPTETLGGATQQRQRLPAGSTSGETQAAVHGGHALGGDDVAVAAVDVSMTGPLPSFAGMGAGAGEGEQQLQRASLAAAEDITLEPRGSVGGGGAACVTTHGPASDPPREDDPGVEARAAKRTRG